MKDKSNRTSHLFLLSMIFCTLLVGQLITVPCGWATNAEYRLTILHTNDVHARIMQFDKSGKTCDEIAAAAGGCFGGVARRSTELEQIRAEGGNVILVDAGDEFEGTLFFTEYKGKTIQRFMNELGYQAMVVGNHEFDKGSKVLADFIRGAEFPVLGANVDAGKDPHLKCLIKPYVVLEVGGERIGILGYTAEDLKDLSSPGPDVSTRPIKSSIVAALDELKKMGIDKIIALSHAGLDCDKKIASQVEGIDVIVGGHTHTFLSNTNPEAEGPYPVVEHSPGGQIVLLVTDFAWGKYLGRLDITFDSAGVVKSWKGNPILLDASVREDPNILKEVNKLYQPLVALGKEIVGTAKVDLTGGPFCRFEECNLGNLITDALLWATASQGTQIAFLNGGGISISIPKGQISRGQIFEVLPFNNSVSTFQMRGADILIALENSVSRAESTKNQGTGRFLQVSGLRYRWNPQRPVGSRLVKVEVRQPDGSYQTINPQATYKVAVSDFSRRGGDGYAVFKEKAIAPHDDGPLLAEVFVEYLKTHSPVSPENEGRIIKTGSLE